MGKVLCIFHKNCMDGLAAAWLVGNRFGFDQVEFHAADYGDTPPDLTDRLVYIVDFSYKPEVLIPAAKEAQHVFIIDHHKTPIADWEKIGDPSADAPITTVFDITRSGAVGVWNFFNAAARNPIPHLFEVLEDYDLWIHKYESTREIVAALYARGYTFRQDWEAFGKLVPLTKNEFVPLFLEGKIILQYNRNFLEGLLARNTRMVKFMGYEVPMANVPKEHSSLAGEMLSKGHPFALTYEDWLPRNERKFSMRSQKTTGVDVEALAKQLGGGGHKNAAGFTMQLERDMGGYIVFEPLTELS